jgi:hypothetical protein
MRRTHIWGAAQLFQTFGFILVGDRTFKLELVGWRSCLEDIEYPLVVAYEQTRESLDIELRR